MNIIIKIKSLFFSLSFLLCSIPFGFAGQSDFAFSEPIESLVKNASFSEYKSLNASDVFNIGSNRDESLGVRLQKSSSNVPGYPGGIYKFEVLGATSVNSLLFKDYSMLKKIFGAALLYINFLEPCQKRTITLPAMDTVIKGESFGNSEFLITREAKSTNKYFFFDKQKHALKIRSVGQVFAADPTRFVVYEDSTTKTIKTLYENNFHKFIAEHTNLEGETKHSDVHTRPARPHQIDQLIEYAKAKQIGVKYMTFEAATGSGKSYTMQRIAELSHGKKVLIVTSRENLVSQFFASFKADFKNLKVTSSDQSKETLIKFLPTEMKRNDVVIVTLQGFQRNDVYKTPDILKDVDIIMFDEAHNLLSLDRKNMVNYLKGYQEKDLEILFFTATPKRLTSHKDSGLLSVLQLSNETREQANITPFDFRSAIDARVNAPFQVAHVGNIKLEDELKKDGDDFNLTHTGKLLSNHKIHEVIFDIYANGIVETQGAEPSPLFGQNAIAFCASIEHAESLATSLVGQANAHKHQNLLAQKRDAYEQKVREYILSFKGTSSPAELKSLWQAVSGSRQSYENWFISDKALATLASDFIKKYPYVFADAVHSGNKTIKMTSDEGIARLLRNKFGGSTILCGADKLTEGFDNPQITVGFMLRPVRKSNTKSMQSFGRLGRIDPTNPNKIAIAIEFIWDKKQLLLFSTDLLGCMHYGLPGSLSISVPNHIANVMDYSISSEARFDGVIGKNTNKRKQTNTNSETTEKIIKKARIEPKEASTESLLNEFQDLIARLQKKAQALWQFTLTTDRADEAEVEELDTQWSVEVESKTATRTVEYPKVRVNNEKDELGDMISIRNLFANASNAISLIKSFFEADRSRPVKAHSESETKILLPLREITNTSLKKTNEMLSKKELLQQLIKKMARAINKSQFFMNDCQINDPACEIQDLLEEIITAGKQIGASDPVIEIPFWPAVPNTNTPFFQPDLRSLEPEPQQLIDYQHPNNLPEQFPRSVPTHIFTKDNFKTATLTTNIFSRHLILQFDNSLTKGHLEVIFNALEGKPDLKKAVSEIQFFSKVTPTIMNDLVRFLEHCSSLSSLEIRYTGHDQSSIAQNQYNALTSAIWQQRFQNLESLWLDSLTSSQLKEVLRVLPQLPKLQKLHLTKSMGKIENCTSLLSAISNLPKLDELIIDMPSNSYFEFNLLSHGLSDNWKLSENLSYMRVVTFRKKSFTICSQLPNNSAAGMDTWVDNYW